MLLCTFGHLSLACSSCVSGAGAAGREFVTRIFSQNQGECCLIPYTDQAHNAHSVPFEQSKNAHSVPILSGV